MIVGRTKLAMAAVLLAAVSAAANPQSANPKAVGSVIKSQGATVRGTALRPGYTIFGGDTIEVGPHGSVSIALPNGARALVFENSRVRLTKTADSVQLTIDRGHAWTDGKLEVINHVSLNPGRGAGLIRDNQRRENDEDCEVSRHHRHEGDEGDDHRDRHCHDD